MVWLGRTLKESPSAKDVSKEAETVLGVCTTVLETFYLEVGTLGEVYRVIRSKMMKVISFD